MSNPIRPVVLLVCDGWGINDDDFGNAIHAAKTPRMDEIMQRWPHTAIEASGLAVGLPDGQQGTSEVGHLTIGTGRVIYQPLTRQHKEIESGIFYENEVLIEAIELARQRGTDLHILGLVSPGGVHSHMNGALALAELAKRLGLTRVHIHAFTDGRDTPPKSQLEHLAEFEKELATIGVGKIASIAGRYYAMDRDNRWERVQLAYEMLVGDEHATHPNAAEYIRQSYDKGETDEFLKPISIAETPDDRVHIKDGDVVVFFNFRPDRARELSHALVDQNFDGFERSRVLKDLHFVAWAEYDSTLGVPIAFPKDNAENSLAEVVSKAGLKQFHVAETEKYAHVTYFMNGGREEPFAGETRTMIPSLKIATFDLQPEMSAEPITEAIIESVEKGEQALIIANLANADMVGHTGNFDPTVQGVEVLDACIGRIVDTTLAKHGAVVITADHGNAEYMIDPETKQPLTSHTNRLVPAIVCGTEVKQLRSTGELSDIAPTVLQIMDLPVPSEMTGKSLLS